MPTPPRPFRFGLQASGPADPQGWTELCRKVEDLGYSTLSLADHFSNLLAPFPALAVAAGVTTRLGLATVVLGNDFRHPAVVARDAATLDALSGGRFEIGLGAGWMTSDYVESGIPLDPAGMRIGRMAESATIIKALLRGETVTLDGEFYSVSELTCLPPPIRPDGPPLFMGGGGKRMLRTAARLANIVGINPNLAAGVIDERAGADATFERATEKIAWVRDAAGSRFGDIELQSRIHIAMVSDRGQDSADELAPAIGLSGAQAMASPHALFGSVDEIVEKLQSLREQLGISYFTWSADSLDAMAPVVARLV